MVMIKVITYPPPNSICSLQGGLIKSAARSGAPVVPFGRWRAPAARLRTDLAQFSILNLARHAHPSTQLAADENGLRNFRPLLAATNLSRGPSSERASAALDSIDRRRSIDPIDSLALYRSCSPTITRPADWLELGATGHWQAPRSDSSARWELSRGGSSRALDKICPLVWNQKRQLCQRPLFRAAACGRLELLADK